MTMLAAPMPPSPPSSRAAVDTPAPMSVAAPAPSTWPLVAWFGAAMTWALISGVARWLDAPTAATWAGLMSFACVVLLGISGAAAWMRLQEPLLECSSCDRLADQSALTAGLCDRCLARESA